MAAIPAAKLSPRIENGVLHWYSGNTFVLNVLLELEDQDGAAVTVSGATDDVTVCFYNEQGQTVKTFSFGKTAQTEIRGNTVQLRFDGETSALFPKGEYRYDIMYQNAERRMDIVHQAKAVVA